MSIERLHYITNGKSESAILKEVLNCIEAGCRWIQLRIKDDALDFEAIGKKVKMLCEGKAVLIFNDNVKLAKELDVDGVHIGLTDMPIQEARKILGDSKIIGATGNTIEDCRIHQENGANYIGLGPFRYTTTKVNLSPILGVNGYQKILAAKNDIRIPVIGIGGIVEEDVAVLRRETNLYGIAVSSLIANSDNQKGLVERLLKELE